MKDLINIIQPLIDRAVLLYDLPLDSTPYDDVAAETVELVTTVFKTFTSDFDVITEINTATFILSDPVFIQIVARWPDEIAVLYGDIFLTVFRNLRGRLWMTRHTVVYAGPATLDYFFGVNTSVPAFARVYQECVTLKESEGEPCVFTLSHRVKVAEDNGMVMTACILHFDIAFDHERCTKAIDDIIQRNDYLKLFSVVRRTHVTGGTEPTKPTWHIMKR